MNRLIRSFWGDRFLVMAEKALATGQTEYVTGQSPRREMAYGFIATNKPNYERADLMRSIAIEALAKNDKREGIIVSASPASVLATYKMFINWFSRGKSDYLKSNTIETLDSTIMYMSLE